MSSKAEGIKTPKQCVNANKERGKGKGRRREKVICSHGECVTRGGTLGISGWGCAAGSLEPLTFTRASSAEFCYPILE